MKKGFLSACVFAFVCASPALAKVKKVKRFPAVPAVVVTAPVQIVPEPEAERHIGRLVEIEINPNCGVTSTFGFKGASGASARCGAEFSARYLFNENWSAGLYVGGRLPVAGGITTNRTQKIGRLVVPISTHTEFTDYWLAPGVRYTSDFGLYGEAKVLFSNLTTSTAIAPLGQTLKDQRWMIGVGLNAGYDHPVNDWLSVGPSIGIQYDRALDQPSGTGPKELFTINGMFNLKAHF